MATTTEPVVTSPGEQDEFANAFAALQETIATPAPTSNVTSGDVPAAVAPAAAADSADTAATVVPVVPDASADVAPATPAAVSAAAIDAPGDTTAAVVAQSVVADPVAARIAQLEAQIAALTPTAAPVVPASAAPVVAPVVTPVYSVEEQAVLDKYAADWPDIVAGEALRRRAEYRDLISYVFDQVRTELTPALEFVQKQSGRTQYSDLVSLVPDYDQVRDKTLAWVDTQPAYLKAAYQQVANSGSAEEVADLIARFKKETGYAPAAAAVVPVAAAPAAAALPPAAAAAVVALRAVHSSRSEPVQAVDQNNFDAAFEEFTKVSR